MTIHQARSTTAEHPLSAVVQAFHQTAAGTLSEQTYEAVRRVILSGDLPPRTKLREVDLASCIPVSRTPIREALRRLRDEGLLTMGSSRALEVRELDLQESLNTYQILEVLEPLAARLAADRVSDELIAQLRESVDLTEFFYEKGRWDDVINESRRYHDLICEASGNDRLVQVIRRLREETHRFRRFRTYDPQRVSRSLEEDRLIIDALARHDADGAHRMMYEHIHGSTARLKALIERGMQADDFL